ncbi:MAG TPA: DUF6537 domain-containing protein, partial [Aquabacterium sp.]|nr:DUF6537 domain-containing protein [Aquabacterium sp.]
LQDYQNAAWADRYSALVARVQQAEAPLGSTRLSLSVARNLFKLMAFKDEYEVARLLTSPAFQAQVNAQFEGDWKMTYHFAPSWLGGERKGQRPRKRTFGPAWQGALKMLAWGRRLRGTWLDPLRFSHEQREHWRLLQDYEAVLSRLLSDLRTETLETACQMAELPDRIRGYGAIRQASAEAVRRQWEHWERKTRQAAEELGAGEA